MVIINEEISYLINQANQCNLEALGKWQNKVWNRIVYKR